MLQGSQFSAVLLSTLVACCLLACSSDKPEQKQVFITEYGTGPDKWVTAWLLSRYLHADSVIRLIEPEQVVPKGIAFDMPSAKIHRTATQSSFESAIELYQIEDQTMQRLANAIHDLEVNFWAAPSSSDAIYIDQAFRALHRQLVNHPEHIECYLLFFDSVYRALQKSDRSGQSLTQEELIIHCSPEQTRVADQKQIVEELPIEQILSAIANDRRVTFIDVREPEEYMEAHIPGAKNLTLRDVDQAAIESFKHDDFIVSYCVKDFRGFEMAKLLQQHGVENAVILNPFGIQGWVAEGLPVVGQNALSIKQGEDWLRQCSERLEDCTNWTTRDQEIANNAQG